MDYLVTFRQVKFLRKSVIFLVWNCLVFKQLKALQVRFRLRSSTFLLSRLLLSPATVLMGKFHHGLRTCIESKGWK
ncbi:hypothetical protein Gotur_015633 [Gossypium turneri]